MWEDQCFHSMILVTKQCEQFPPIAEHRPSDSVIIDPQTNNVIYLIEDWISIITMKREQLPISALPAYAKLNDISFRGVSVRDLGEKGFGVAAEIPLTSGDGGPSLLHIPHSLILCAETVEEHAKFDQHFRQLLDVAGGKVTVKISDL